MYSIFINTFFLYDVVTNTLINTSHAKSLFEDSGISVAEWARARGFSSGLVYQVLEGNRKCLRGQSHRIAIALGLKKGATMGVEELSKQLEAGAQGANLPSKGTCQ